MFAAVQLKASYVSLHVYPLYTHPELMETLSAEMRARLHGKSCFNFKNEGQLSESEIVTLFDRAYKYIRLEA